MDKMSQGVDMILFLNNGLFKVDLDNSKQSSEDTTLSSRSEKMRKNPPHL